MTRFYVPLGGQRGDDVGMGYAIIVEAIDVVVKANFNVAGGGKIIVSASTLIASSFIIEH